MATRFIVLFAACLQLTLASNSLGYGSALGSPAFYNYNTASSWSTPAWSAPAVSGGVSAWKTPAALSALPWAAALPSKAWSLPSSEAPWTTPAQVPNPIYYPSASWDTPGQEIYWNSPAPFNVGNNVAPTSEAFGHTWNTPAAIPANLALPGYANPDAYVSPAANLGALPAPAPGGLGALPSPAPAGLGALPAPAPAGLGALPSPAPAGLGALPYPAAAGLGAYPGTAYGTPACWY